MRLSEGIGAVIRLAEASQQYWDRELPKRHPHYPVIREGEDSGPAPPEEGQLEVLLRSLPEEQIYALILLMYIGRGDFGTNHLAENYKAMKETFETPAMAIAQMKGTGTLAEYLSDGLAELKKHNIDPDALDIAATTVPA
jgi:Protein of unknown function (DUF3775)